MTRYLFAKICFISFLYVRQFHFKSKAFLNIHVTVLVMYKHACLLHKDNIHHANKTYQGTIDCS